MRKPTRHHLMLAAILGVGIAVTPVGPGAAATGGDPAAKADVIAAFARLSTLPGYRIKVASRDATGVSEFVSPDKAHHTMHGSGGTIEYVIVGKEGRVRYELPGQPAGWQCLATGSRTSNFFDVDKMRKDMPEPLRKPDTAIDGTPVRVYVDSTNPGNILSVGTKTGLPRRFVDASKESGGTLDFYDYGAKITITLPPCK